MYSNPDQFVKEFKDLLPPATDENIVFSHNDVTGLNFLTNDSETKLLDFEYSTYNFRATDLATFINESAIDYSTPSEFGFTIDFDHSLDFEEEEGPVDKIVSAYLTNYCKLS